MRTWKGLRKKKGQRVGWKAYGCCNRTLRFRRTWPTAATWSHEEMPQDLKGLGALLTMSKNKKWKLILENPEVSPSPSLIRSWLKLLLTGHWTKGIKSPAISQSSLLLHCGLSGRQASFAAVRGTGTNFPLSLLIESKQCRYQIRILAVILVCLPRSLLCCQRSEPELCYLFSITHLFYVAMPENKLVIQMLLSSPLASPLEPH